MKKKLIYVEIIICTLIVGVVGTTLAFHFFPLKTNTVEKTVSEVNITETNTMSSAIDKVYNAVVIVQSYKASKLVGTGTGVVYKVDDSNGYIITNHHVIEGSSTVKIVNMNNETYEAKLLGSDEYSDIAILSIKKEGSLAVAAIGDTSELKLGDTVFTVGTPLGAEYMGTVTKGIISGKNRKVSVDLTNGSFVMEVLQTDAAINPGNSGGPLCNINGQVIGITSMKLVQDEIEGMGFAIPIELVMSSVGQLEKGEKVVRPVLGVETIDVSNTYYLYKNDLLVDDKIDSGVVIATVVDGMPAKDSGLQRGDVILKINDDEVVDSGHLKYNLYKHSIGDTIKVTYYRDGDIKQVDVKLTKSLEGE